MLYNDQKQRAHQIANLFKAARVKVISQEKEVESIKKRKPTLQLLTQLAMEKMQVDRFTAGKDAKGSNKPSAAVWVGRLGRQYYLGRILLGQRYHFTLEVDTVYVCLGCSRVPGGLQRLDMRG